MMTVHQLGCLSSSAPIAAFRKRDKHEKDDVVPERMPQGRSRFFLLVRHHVQTMCRVFDVFFFCFFPSCLCPDEPLPRASSQVQAAEDILDKYRNIKRSSPSDGAAGGTSYDGTGGENKNRLNDGMCRQLERWTSFYFLGQIFAAKTASTTPPEKTPCRTSRPTTSWTRPARRPGSTTPSFPSGPRSTHKQTASSPNSLETH